MEKLLIMGHKNPDTDSICSSIVFAEIQRKMTGEEVEAVRLGNINKETEYVLKYFGVEPQRQIERVEEGQQVILVDHNEFTQSVEGIEKAKIMGVVDHHKIANFQTTEPLFYMAQPVGCTATIIYEICLMNNIEISKQMAGLLLSSIISDTLLFKSPVCTVKDIEMANKLEKIAEINKEEYGLEMLKAGTKLDGYTEEELLNIDLKKYEKDNVKYIVAQVNTASIEDVIKRQSGIEEAMKKIIDENSSDLCLFAITDIINSNSEAIVMGKRTDIIEKTYKIENNRIFMPGVVSRKKQITPFIEANI